MKDILNFSKKTEAELLWLLLMSDIEEETGARNAAYIILGDRINRIMKVMDELEEEFDKGRWGTRDIFVKYYTEERGAQ